MASRGAPRRRVALKPSEEADGISFGSRPESSEEDGSVNFAPCEAQGGARAISDTSDPPASCRLLRVSLDDGCPPASCSSAGRRWAEVPQDLGVLICQSLGPNATIMLLAVSRRMLDLGLCDEVWRFFCRMTWGRSANLRAYARAKDLYCDSNGWFPQDRGCRRQPAIQVHQMTLHDSPCLTMDLRITDDEIIAVSEAPRGRLKGRHASVHIVDPETRQLKERFEVSNATINCCDTGPGLVCLGSDDSKVRLYRRSASLDENDNFGNHSAMSAFCRTHMDEQEELSCCYQVACEYSCASEVNDLRFAREGAVIAVRTHQNRHPAGLDVIPLGRPDVRISFPGGGWATKGKYIHALDGFEDGCSLSKVACSGEHPLTSAFSAMLFDFRRSAPCVADLPVTSAWQGHPMGTMLWPLRAGSSPKVYANLLHEEGRRQGRGCIAMVDFRYPSPDTCVRFELPEQVDDFRCFGGCIYATCTKSIGNVQRLSVYRCDPSRSEVAEQLCTVVEQYDAAGRSSREDLKVFSICSRGFAVSYGEHLALGTVTSPSWRNKDLNIAGDLSIDRDQLQRRLF